ncbi:hypothetical protein [Maridesulfovibrio bastinii]|uniref:hypothetical protein n=1 Tax=Maridesulfovibrio bastinii TaxID=47157 RepID=UPI000403C992|nr:hypothetical protein [Maridesulfovibrio bastinii]
MGTLSSSVNLPQVIPMSAEAKVIHDDLLAQEQLIRAKYRSFETADALRKLKSGRDLIKLKDVVNKGRRKGYFETVVGLMFRDENGVQLIKKTARCDRMKVARFKDAEDFHFLGWTNLVTVSEVASNNYNKIADFFKKISFDPMKHKKLTSKEFSVAVKSAEITFKLKEEQVGPIKEEFVRTAVRRKINFDSKFMKVLSNSSNPEALLRAKVEYNATKVPNYTKNTEPDVGDIEILFDKLHTLLKYTNFLGDEKGKLDHIPGYLFEDLAHELGYAFVKAGYSGEKANANVFIVHDV